MNGNFKDLLGNYDRKRSMSCISLCKNRLRLFRMGHGTLKGHLRKLGLIDDTTCTYCEAGEETLCYLLVDGKVIAIRARMLGK